MGNDERRRGEEDGKAEEPRQQAMRHDEPPPGGTSDRWVARPGHSTPVRLAGIGHLRRKVGRAGDVHADASPPPTADARHRLRIHPGIWASGLGGLGGLLVTSTRTIPAPIRIVQEHFPPLS